MHSELKTIFRRAASVGKTTDDLPLLHAVTASAFDAAVASSYAPFSEINRLKRVLRRQAEARQQSEERRAKRKAQRRARAITRRKG